MVALQAALNVGITFYDTAPAYGEGNSERLIGEAFKNDRDKVVIATKVGYQNWNKPPDFRPDAIKHSIEGSLKRLQSDHIDLLQLHNACENMGQEYDEITKLLETFVSNGVIKAWGVSAKSPADGIWAIEKLHAQAIQLNINMLDMRAATSGLIDLAIKKGIGLIARTPLCFGFLAGSLSSNTNFSLGDHRNNWSHKQKDVWLKGADMMLELADPERKSPAAETALKFCLSVPGVSCTIPGILSKNEAMANAKAADAEPLQQKRYQRILEINAESNFFVSE